MKRGALILAALLALSGCAQKEDVLINRDYHQAATDHSKAEAELGDSKAAYISEMMIYDCGTGKGTEACGMAQALIRVIAAREIASIKTTPFALKRPTTSLDVQEAAVNKIGAQIGTIGLGVVAYKQADKGTGATSNTINNQADGTVTIKDGMNQTEVHATAVDGSSASVTQSRVEGTVGEESEEEFEVSEEMLEAFPEGCETCSYDSMVEGDCVCE